MEQEDFAQDTLFTEQQLLEAVQEAKNNWGSLRAERIMVMGKGERKNDSRCSSAVNSKFASPKHVIAYSWGKN